MKRKWRYLIAAAVILSAGGIAALTLGSGRSASATTDSDPRSAPRLVRIVSAVTPAGANRAFTGIIAARVQSNLGFRVPGKIVERLVDVGQEVRAGQALMRIDETDLRLALTAKRNAFFAARAVAVQARADEKRYAILSREALGASAQRYEQAKAALDTAEAQLAAAEADARVAENGAGYSTLIADADGTVVATLGEPGQVVTAGQTVVQLAQAGPREAVLALPETIRPQLGAVAEASIFGDNGRRWQAHLRQISNAADAQTRTYEARYVLDGDASSSPLGATVTVRIASSQDAAGVVVPMGAIFDDGTKTGVWIFDGAKSIVRFRSITIKQVREETAVISGVDVGEPVVALGAHLLKDGSSVRTTALAEVAGK